ncbi:hypothetical protein BJV82DRAFT_686308 [Fennellomyces sp. T-0311]|nr:hypothetical protein BJV82DRAFT_584468 [Fennellomyces sp. T-0311]KAI8142633.1 hypothetical protein BJV82DRAFT_686308 [Fennellomyces sp. T-0311]
MTMHANQPLPFVDTPLQRSEDDSTADAHMSSLTEQINQSNLLDEQEAHVEHMDFTMEQVTLADKDSEDAYIEAYFERYLRIKARSIHWCPFKTEKIDLDLVPDFPKQHKQQFLEKISKEGCVILGLMLASDKTVITGNLRNSAWPIYLKLANTPFEYRTKDTLHGTRLLAYLPVIESKRLSNKKWFPLAKKAIFHYCIGLVMAPFRKFDIFKMQGPDQKVYKCIPALAAYSADYQEQ